LFFAFFIRLVGAADGDWVPFEIPTLVTVTATPSTTIGVWAVPVAIPESTDGVVPAGNPMLTTTDPQSYQRSSVDPSIIWVGVSAAASATILALIAVSSAAL